MGTPRYRGKVRNPLFRGDSSLIPLAWYLHLRKWERWAPKEDLMRMWQSISMMAAGLMATAPSPSIHR